MPIRAAEFAHGACPDSKLCMLPLADSDAWRFLFVPQPDAHLCGVAIYLVLTVFQLVTLPVEFNASTRAKAAMRELGIIEGGEARGVEDVLDAAAFTYVAAFISSLGWLLYLFAASNNRD